jgi:nucleotide-binding universal stress UspA family protein
MQTTEPTRPVLVGVDGSQGSDKAVEWAALEARRRGVSLVVMAVYELKEVATLNPVPEPGSDAAAAETVERAADRARTVVPGLEVLTETRQGHADRELIDASQGASQLVVGSRGLGAVRAAVLGSVSGACAARAHCPVTVIPAETAER